MFSGRLFAAGLGTSMVSVLVGVHEKIINAKKSEVMISTDSFIACVINKNFSNFLKNHSTPNNTKKTAKSGVC